MYAKIYPNTWAGFLTLALLYCFIYESTYAQLRPKSMLLPSFAPDPRENDQFGYSVAASGNTIIVGAFLDDRDVDGMNKMMDAGAAYIMEKNEAGGWEMIQKLTPSDRAPGDYFGIAVDIRRDYVLIGSSNKTYHPTEGNGDSLVFAGAVYVFRRDESGKWVEEQKLLPDIPAAYGQFGYSLSLGTYGALIGAPGESYDENGENFVSGAGAAYAFERIPDSVLAMKTSPVDQKGDISVFGNFYNNQKLVAAESDRQNNYFYGYNTFKSRDNAFVTALGMELEGIVHAYKHVERIDLLAGRGWSPLKGTPILTMGNYLQTSRFFGEGLRLKNNFLVIGAPGLNYGTNGETVNHVGVLNFYNKTDEDNYQEVGMKWPEDIKENSFFGGDIKLNMVNTPSSYKEESSDELAKFFQVFVNRVTGKEDDYNSMYPEAGSLDLYRIALTTPISFSQEEIGEVNSKAEGTIDVKFIKSIVPDDPAAGDNFGFTLDGSGNDLVIGAPLKDFIMGEDTMTNAGAVYFHQICEPIESTMVETACVSYISPSGKYTWTESGTYMDTLINFIGCDSILTVELTVNNIDSTVSQTENILEANQEDASYQWLDCDNNYMPVDGATEKTFIAEKSENYAVKIMVGDCVDTSACYTVNLTGLPSLQGNLVRLYPNPATTGFYTLELGKHYDKVSIEIIHSSGQIIFDRKYARVSSVDFQIDGPAGIYLVRVRTDQQEFIGLKAIKQ